MTRYRVSWDVEVDADSPAQAALKGFASRFCVPGAPTHLRVTELADRNHFVDQEFDQGIFDVLEETRRLDKSGS